MRHDPVACPKCGTEFDAEAVVKTRRVRAAAVAETVIGPIIAEEVDPELVNAIASEDVPDALPPETEVESEEEGAETEGEEAEEEEEVPEDASELGEDEDDMAEVIENVDDEEER
jgi:hypothetical protein